MLMMTAAIIQVIWIFLLAVLSTTICQQTFGFQQLQQEHRSCYPTKNLCQQVRDASLAQGGRGGGGGATSSVCLTSMAKRDDNAMALLEKPSVTKKNNNRKRKAMSNRPSGVQQSQLLRKEATNKTTTADSLYSKIESYITNNEDLEQIQKAMNLSILDPSSTNRQRSTGEEDNCIYHAVGIAHIMVDMKLDASTIIAGLLYSHIDGNNTPHRDHNLDDNTEISLQYVEDEFGITIRNMVEGVSKITNAIRSSNNNKKKDRFGAGDLTESQKKTNEQYRKMIVAMAEDDIRILLVKLADQTQTIRELVQRSDNSSDSKQIAKETLDLFAPLAHRLGLYTLKTELEEMSFRVWQPEEYNQLEHMVSTKKEQRQRYTDTVIQQITDFLNEEGLPVRSVDNQDDSHGVAMVSGRAKSFYAIHQKMNSKKKAFDDIQDLIAFRILVNNVSQCYEALGIVTSKWEPIPGRFKDYVAKPKPNGYQSLHTTVIGPGGKFIEVQIRTYQMHDDAENGVAAHFIYKSQNGGGAGGKKKKDQDEAKRYTWLRQLVEWVQTSDDKDGGGNYNNEPLLSTRQDADGKYYLTTKKEATRKVGDDDESNDELMNSGVFVFSPQGQLFEITKGSSVLDFAYRIHSDLGNHCVGAKVDGKMVPLKHRLKNGETVEIMKSSTQRPRQEWLKIVQTSKAKSRIKAWLYKEQRSHQQADHEPVAHGKELLEKALLNYASSSQRLLHNKDGIKTYKENLTGILSKFGFDDERDFLLSLSSGQISVASVVQAIFSSRGPSLPQRLGDIVNSEEMALPTLEDSDSTSNRPTQRDDGIVVGGKRNILVTYCRNCNPLYGEEISGVVTQGRGVKVHRTDCKYLIDSEEERHVDAVWDETVKSAPRRATEVEIIFEDESGMLNKITKIILSCKIKIGGVTTKKLLDGRGLTRLGLMLSSIDDLNLVTQSLLQEKEIISVKRR